ncbi:hypothetical protein NMG60_11024956 [Bertholletia excelsa]
MCWSWGWSRVWLPEFGFTLPSSIFRWAWVDLSAFSHIVSGWSSPNIRSWFDYSVDNVLWTFVTVVETLALVTMLCYFFMFCGCTL